LPELPRTLLSDDDRAWLREYIGRVRWRAARTGAPHAYTIRSWQADEASFERAVVLIRRHGYDADFEGRTYTYLDLDGYAYWSMGAPLDETVVLNRHVVEQSSSEDAAARSESSGRGGQGAPAPSGLGDANAARRLVAAAKPTKKWPEMTDEEKHAFAQGLLAQMKKNVPQKPSGS
jgi:hypothetical protein